MKITHTHWILALLTLSAVLAAGCEMERRVVSQTGWTKMFMESEWYDGPARGSKDAQATNRNNRGYAVELGKYSGAQAFHGVHGLMQTARQDAGLANLWYATGERGDVTVYMGRFKDDDSKEAKAALRLARDAEVNGSAVFENAKIVKLTSARGGEVLDPRDLRTLKGKGMYTLQIGYYDAKYGPDFRRAAETAVDVLRDQDEEAFYYHGPHRSMVLVNAWNHNQAFTLVGQVDRYSNVVRMAQERYPHNVPNGRAFTDDDDPEFVKSQRSFLVPIR
ncbi:MAG: hypothetical protein AB8C95_15775 [Phycisphaeraceae bacterium]